MRVNSGSSRPLYPGHIIRIGDDIDWEQLRKEDEARAAGRPVLASEAVEKELETLSIRQRKEQGSSEANGAEIAEEPETKKNADAATDQEELKAPVGTESPRRSRLDRLMHAETVDLDEVRKVSWGGVPAEWRPAVWKVLLGHVPSNAARRIEILDRKRKEYREAVEQHYASTDDLRDDQQQSMLKQIVVDIPRTSPGQALFQIPEVQSALERVLYVWATRHPASGYVQGMNDLVTPFFFVFLSEFVDTERRSDILTWTSLDHLDNSSEALSNSEADAYWCLTSLLSGIQDYYTFAQPGIQRRVHYLRDLIGRVDQPLRAHLDEEGLDFLQFAFRWMNCLLMRELPFPLIIRIWDTYLAEPEGFATFHVYVCAALLSHYRDELIAMDFQDLVMFLQHLPTEEWGEKELQVLLSQAYTWKSIFGSSPSHLHKGRL